MRRLVPALAAVAVLLAPPSLDAQSRATLRNRNPRPSAFVVSTGYSAQWGDLDDHVNETRRGPLVGGTDAGPHVGLGAAFAIPSSALELRAEAFYNQLRGPVNTVMMVGEAGQTARMARRDRVFALGTVLLWRARPAHRVGPYLMTGLGVYHTRLTSAPVAGDPRELNVSGTTYGASFGAGFEAPVLGRQYFVEFRRHLVAEEGIRGGPFVPLTVGTRF